MLIENMMYFALGLLVAGLLALIILPAVWKRAVRLTKRRIEAATPITMAEFRADKDQLRAEFALSTRRLEMTIDQLRTRATEQLGEINTKRAEFVVLKAERDEAVGVAQELEAREAELKGRVQELERETVDLAQKLRMREREFETRTQEWEALRQTGATVIPPSQAVDGEEDLTGSYEEDIQRLTAALDVERRRATVFEEQAQALLARLESSDQRSAEASAAIAQMREALAKRGKSRNAKQLAAAEARIANAEKQLNELLNHGQPVVLEEGQTPSLAEELTQDERVEQLRSDVLGIEKAIVSDKADLGERATELRARLHYIAGSVSQLVYAAEPETNADTTEEQSLFERMQRFAEAEDAAMAARQSPGAITDRMAAIQEIRGR